MRQHCLFGVSGVFGDVPEQRQPDLRVQALVAKDFADEPHQLALQYSALRGALGWPLTCPLACPCRGGDCGGVPGRQPLRRGGLPMVVTG